MDKLKIVKFMVFILTFLIIFGMIMAGMTIYKKIRHSESKNNIQISLQQPRGSKITDIKTIGDMVVLLINGGGLSDRVILVRTGDQSVAATINLN